MYCFHPLVICYNLFLLYIAVYCKLKPSWELLILREPTPNIFLFLSLDTDFQMPSFSNLTSFYEIERLDLKGRPFTPHKYKNIHSPYPPRQKFFLKHHIDSSAPDYLLRGTSSVCNALCFQLKMRAKHKLRQFEHQQQ